VLEYPENRFILMVQAPIFLSK